MNFDILRQKILEKAIRGELVPQLESEPEVRQIGEAPDDVPFSIPEKWKWCNFGNVVAYGKSEQVQPQNIEKSAWILDLEDIESGTGNLLQKKKSITAQSNKTRFRKGDVLYSKLRPYLNKVIVADDDGYCTTEIVPISPSVAQAPLDAQYLKIYLMSPYFVGYANQCSYGVKMPRLGTKDAQKALFPIPPIEEQRRIVAKLNQLFEQIDRAEKAYNELSGPLSDRFRQLCLEKAIQGKLVPQLESEPAVEQIGKAPEDVPFTIPEKWKWVCLSNLGKLSTGTTPKTSDKDLYGGNLPFIKPGEISEKGDLLPPNQFLTEAGKEQARVVSAGAVLMVCIGTIGKTAIANVDLSFNQQINAIAPKGYLIDPIYLHSVFRSSWFQSHVKALASATTIKIVNKNKWGSSYIPLPPLDEQHRIIEKLNELLGTVGQLENAVSAP